MQTIKSMNEDINRYDQQSNNVLQCDTLSV